MIIFSTVFYWALGQVDFVMVYPQAPIETDIYIELPQGIQTTHGNSKDHVLKLENTYMTINRPDVYGTCSLWMAHVHRIHTTANR
jgi:hypothetical protein